MTQESLKNAVRAKDDEWYTPDSYVKYELDNYNFEGMHVSCPFDSSVTGSAFVRYFCDLVKNGRCASVTWSHKDLGYSIRRDKKAVSYYEIPRGGDFFNPENKHWRTADVVVSNPPFSIYNRVLQETLGEGVKFLYVAPCVVADKSIFIEAWKNNRVHVGFTPARGVFYDRPEGRPVKDVKSLYITNLDVDVDYSGRIIPEPGNSARCFAEYSEQLNGQTVYWLDKWANFPAGLTTELLAVPVSGWWRIDPAKYEIIGAASHLLKNELEDGRVPFFRIIIRKKDA